MVRLATNGFFRFCRKCFGMKVDRRLHRCADIKFPLCLSKMRTALVHFNHCYWLHGLSRLLIGGLLWTETGYPTINHRWSIRRARILHFLTVLQLTKKYAYFDNHASNMAASSWTIGHGLWRKKLLGCQSDQYLVMSGSLNRFIGRIWRPGERLAVALVYHYYTAPSNPFTLFL